MSSSSSGKMRIYVSILCKLILCLVPLTAVRREFLESRAEKRQAAVMEFIEIMDKASKEVKEELVEAFKNRRDDSEVEAESDNSDGPQIIGEGRRVCEWCRVLGVECEWKGGSGKFCELCKLHDRDCIVDGKALSGERRVGVIQPEDYENEDDYAEGLYFAALEDKITELLSLKQTLLAKKKQLTDTIRQLHQVFCNLRLTFESEYRMRGGRSRR